MRISDWSSDVCSSDLFTARRRLFLSPADRCKGFALTLYARFAAHLDAVLDTLETEGVLPADLPRKAVAVEPPRDPARSEEHTSELQSLMRISYAVFCLKKKIQQQDPTSHSKTT